MELILGSEEQMVKKESFNASLLLVWLKTDFTLTTKRIGGTNPNTMLGIIPLGQKQFTYPLKNIASVSSSTQFHFWRLIIGIVLSYIGLKMFGESFLGGLVLALLGLSCLLNCYTVAFSIANNAGQAPAIELSILEKDKVAALVSDINHKISEL